MVQGTGLESQVTNLSVFMYKIYVKKKKSKAIPASDREGL
jgi:hypothetical protein